MSQCVSQDVRHVEGRLLLAEGERIGKVLAHFEEEEVNASRQWKRILRNLKNERGPWGEAEGVVHWKLDKTENYSRMRLKLKRNYNFNDHADAALGSEEVEQSAPDTILDSGNQLAALGAIETGEEDKEDWLFVGDEDTEKTELLEPQGDKEKIMYHTTPLQPHGS